MTYSNIGKQKRLDKLFTNGKTVIVPIDDSLISGPQDGLYNIGKTIDLISSGTPNAIMGYRGALEYISKNKINIPFIYNLSASTTLSTNTKKVLISSVESAIKADVECVAFHINLSSIYESEMLKTFSEIANECDYYGIPLLAIAYPRTENNSNIYNYYDLKEHDPEQYTKLVSHCVRIASELGADIIKTQYTGSLESFKIVVNSAYNKPVIIAGGSKIPNNESIEIIRNAIDAGAAGISFGRNVFNSENIIQYIDLVKTIIYDK